jgi:hypothetical protein
LVSYKAYVIRGLDLIREIKQPMRMGNGQNSKQGNGPIGCIPLLIGQFKRIYI